MSDDLKHFNDLVHRFHQQLFRPSLDEHAKQVAYARVDEHRHILSRIQRQGGKEDYILTYVQQQREQFKAGGRDPVCTCTDSSCPLKSGRLPKELHDAAHIDVGIREFKHTHQGRPVVLDEARREWEDMVADAILLLREAITIIANEAIPEDVTAPPGSVVFPRGHDDNDNNDEDAEDGVSADGVTA